MRLNFKRLGSEQSLPLPSYATTGSAALDISSAETLTLPAGKTRAVKTGFAVEVPPHHELQVRSRSGLAAKHGIFVLNSPGTIDSDYRGEIMVILHNASPADYEVTKGDRIAQLLLSPVLQLHPFEVDELSGTARGLGGLGSTGL